MAAVASLARRAGAVVDLEACLKIAELAARLDMIAQGRAAIADRAQQHLLDRRHEALGSLALHGVSRAARRDAGHIESLAGIDVAHTDQSLLVEQRRLDRC